MEKRFYIAYGSNLHIQQMKQRCPEAELYDTGVIPDYELQFKGTSTGAFATIAPRKGAAVPVAVWKISERDEKYLDRYEGFPHHYLKDDIDVKMKNGVLRGMVYRMPRECQFGIPSPRYYRVVRQGYEDCGFDINILDRAVDESSDRFWEKQIEEVEEAPSGGMKLQ